MRRAWFCRSQATGNDVEGVLGQTATEDFIKASHASGQLPNGHSILGRFICVAVQNQPRFLKGTRPTNSRPSLAHEAQSERLSDEYDQQLKQTCGNCERRLGTRRTSAGNSSELFEFQATVSTDPDALQCRDSAFAKANARPRSDLIHLPASLVNEVEPRKPAPSHFRANPAGCGLQLAIAGPNLG